MRTFVDAVNFIESELTKSERPNKLMRVSERLHKSKSFIAPIARQIMHRNISLKEALDSVPWWMQSELLKYLKDHD